eukprot:15003915-Heterocapsa_arctica.AAC.1
MGEQGNHEWAATMKKVRDEQEAFQAKVVWDHKEVMNSTVWRSEQITQEQTVQIQSLHEEMVSRDARNASETKQMAEHMASLQERLHCARVAAPLYRVGTSQFSVMATVGVETK